MPRFSDPEKEKQWRQKLAEKAKKQWANPEIRAKMQKALSESLEKRWAEPATRAQMLEARRRIAANPEYRKKISELQKKRWQDPEYRARQRQTRLVAYNTPEHREKMRQAAKRRWERAEYREAVIAHVRRRCSDPGYRARLAKATRALWNSAEFKQQRVMLLLSREYRLKLSESIRASWACASHRERRTVAIRRVCATPEYRAKVSEGLRNSLRAQEYQATIGERKRQWWATMSPEERKIRTRAFSEAGHRAAQLANPSKIELMVARVLDDLRVEYIQQKQVGPYLADFLLPQYNAILECYGDYWHNRPDQIKKDHRRQKYLEKCGYKVIVLWEHDIRSDVLGSVLKILDVLKSAESHSNLGQVS